MKSFDYCIVGGGSGGIGCLKSLLNKGVESVKLFEGRNEILYSLSFMPTVKQSSGEFGELSGTEFRELILEDKSIYPYISLDSRLIALDPANNMCTFSINGLKNLEIQYKKLIVATGAVQSMYGKNLLPGYRGAGIFTTCQISEMLTHYDFNPGKRIALLGNSEYCEEAEYIINAAGLEAVPIREKIYSIHGREHIEKIETRDMKGSKKVYNIDALAVDGGFVMEHKMRDLLGIEWDITENKAETTHNQRHPDHDNIFIVGDAYSPGFNFLSQYLGGYSIAGGIL